MDEKSLVFVNQLVEKTEQGKLSWSTGFEDGQFKTILPGGKLAFAVQVKPQFRKFLIFDDCQEIILEETIPVENASVGQIDLPNDLLFEGIGKLQGLARIQALQVNEKLAYAEKLLDAI